MSDDQPTDPSTKFGARAAQVTVPVVGDDRPSIAELQRIEREDLGPSPQEILEWWSPGDRGRIALRNAAPVLLEIAAAALAWKATRMVPGIAAEREAAHVLIAALGKVLP